MGKPPPAPTLSTSQSGRPSFGNFLNFFSISFLENPIKILIPRTWRARTPIYCLGGARVASLPFPTAQTPNPGPESVPGGSTEEFDSIRRLALLLPRSALVWRSLFGMSVQPKCRPSQPTHSATATAHVSAAKSARRVKRLQRPAAAPRTSPERAPHGSPFSWPVATARLLDSIRRRAPA
jgi:hypothetical protein